MDSLNTSSQSYIYSVVDEKRDIGRLGYSMQSFGDANLFSSVASLVTQLNDCDACQNVRFSGLYFMTVVLGPPSTAARTTSTRSWSPRMAGVLSVTRYTE
jgi:hypothetical protein